jgi:hypothetical protein
MPTLRWIRFGGGPVARRVGTAHHWVGHFYRLGGRCPPYDGSVSKHASVDVSSRAIALCRQAGIEPDVSFLMHTPDAFAGDLFHNLDFLEKNGLLDRLERTANLLCHRQIVFRGTLKTAGANQRAHRQVNNRLVNAFKDALHQAARAVTLAEVESARRRACTAVFAMPELPMIT